MTLKEKTERVLAVAYSGLHNVPGKIKHDDLLIEVCVPAQLSTFDFDTLTRLVVLSHDQCVRLSVTNGGPRKVKLMFHDRIAREGQMHERHPTIEEAIPKIRASAFNQP